MNPWKLPWREEEGYDPEESLFSRPLSRRESAYLPRLGEEEEEEDDIASPFSNSSPEEDPDDSLFQRRIQELLSRKSSTPKREALKQALLNPPKVGWKRRLGAAALGFAQGFANANPHARFSTDLSGAMEEVKRPGYQERLQGLSSAAALEAQQEQELQRELAALLEAERFRQNNADRSRYWKESVEAQKEKVAAEARGRKDETERKKESDQEKARENQRRYQIAVLKAQQNGAYLTDLDAEGKAILSPDWHLADGEYTITDLVDSPDGGKKALVVPHAPILLNDEQLQAFRSLGLSAPRRVSVEMLRQLRAQATAREQAAARRAGTIAKHSSEWKARLPVEEQKLYSNLKDRYQKGVASTIKQGFSAKPNELPAAISQNQPVPWLDNLISQLDQQSISYVNSLKGVKRYTNTGLGLPSDQSLDQFASPKPGILELLDNLPPATREQVKAYWLRTRGPLPVWGPGKAPVSASSLPETDAPGNPWSKSGK